MNIVSKIVAGIGLLGIAFVAGWASRPAEVQVETKTVVQEVEKTVTKVVKETATKPDGTTTTTETTTSTSDITTTKDKINPQVAPVAVTAPRDWSVGVQWQPSIQDPTWQPASATVGYRITGPVWVEGGVDWRHGAAIVGVRLEF